MAAPRDRNSEAYRWWQQGATDEAEIRREGLSKEGLEVTEVIDGLAKLAPGQSGADLITGVARIFCPDRLKRRYR